ncbi:hypothetical protein JM93_03463 [Roseibium hamelinense]|uniref:Uncharacterized protein n=1 Tax=Roseibium hamelinense TaxID=150831 RepID=A0A562SNZ7_9HYPH|nr:hypothetical protein JM93_03463 [Roseibium hamelinense]
MIAMRCNLCSESRWSARLIDGVISLIKKPVGIIGSRPVRSGSRTHLSRHLLKDIGLDGGGDFVSSLDEKWRRELDLLSK